MQYIYTQINKYIYIYLSILYIVIIYILCLTFIVVFFFTYFSQQYIKPAHFRPAWFYTSMHGLFQSLGGPFPMPWRAFSKAFWPCVLCKAFSKALLQAVFGGLFQSLAGGGCLFQSLSAKWSFRKPPTWTPGSPGRPQLHHQSL